jgi:hypothetical protein
MPSPQFVASANTPRLHAAYNHLVGEGRWLSPQGLGTFPIRYRSNESAGDDGWHVDGSFETENPDFMEWRANVMSSGRALPMLFLFSDVGPDEAPTRIRKGSRVTIARELLTAKLVPSSDSFRPTDRPPRKIARSLSPPVRRERFISAILAWFMRPSRILGPSHASWHSRL